MSVVVLFFCRRFVLRPLIIALLFAAYWAQVVSVNRAIEQVSWLQAATASASQRSTPAPITRYVNVYESLFNKEGLLDSKVQYDKLHPTAEGYARLMAAVMPVVLQEYKRQMYLPSQQ